MGSLRVSANSYRPMSLRVNGTVIINNDIEQACSLTRQKVILPVMLKHLSQSISPITDLANWNFTEQAGLQLAAVLIPIVIRNNTHSIILTKRSQGLNNHAGQISFPGGRAEKADKNALDTALRETNEEVGISHEQIKVAGFLDLYTTVSDFIITPIVGFIDADYQAQIDAFEVEYVFEVPCEILLNDSNYQRNKIFWQGEMRLFWELNYEDHHIWGATAAILKNLATRLTAIEN